MFFFCCSQAVHSGCRLRMWWMSVRWSAQVLDSLTELPHMFPKPSLWTAAKQEWLLYMCSCLDQKVHNINPSRQLWIYSAPNTLNKLYCTNDLSLWNLEHVRLTGTLEPVVVKNNRDGTHTVNYTPAQEGPHTVSVKYANQEVPNR